MKRILMICMVALLGVSIVGAQSKKDVKAAKKQAKIEAKTLTKQGWVLLESGMLEKNLADQALRKTNGKDEIVGTAESMRSINMGKSVARNNALNEYAELQRSMLRARIVSELSAVNEDQVENLVAGYERLVAAEIRGEVRPSFTIYKTNKDGSVNVRSYFVIDQEAAHSARKRALELAMEESELRAKYGEKISSFIDEGFKKLKD